MRKYIIIITIFLTVLETSAQDYLISFAATGITTSVNNVKVENLTKGTMVNLNEGDILHLKSTLGIEISDMSDSRIQLFPNPVNEQSILTFISLEKGNVIISLEDITGKTIYQINKMLENGVHSFRISGICSGMYFLNVSGSSYNYSVKLVGKGVFHGKTKIEYVSSIEITPAKNLKNTAAIIDMQYSEGDLLLFKGVTGDYSTIITDKPNSSKTIVFNFLSCKDYDGNCYSTVKVSEQTWMAENLKTTHYTDGTEITIVESDSDWNDLSYTDKAFSYYENSLSNGNIYGALYTWAAAMNGAESSETNPSFVQGVCPCGWHLPSDEEWIELEMSLGMSYEEAYAVAWRGTDEGAKMKTSSGWNNNGNGNNSSGFSALPGGSRKNNIFIGIGENTCFWSTTEYININFCAFNRTLSSFYSQVGWFSAAHYYGYPKDFGLSVRCIKD
jgi:uncharacterized protein (TIGR02145 family)